MKDLYKVLGVAENASEAEIKKAYRRLAKANHPDATGGDKAKTERFKEIGDAYAILGDTNKRAEYDRLRHAPVGADGTPQGFDPRAFEEIFGDLGRRGGPGGFRTGTFDGGPVNLADLFSNLFGGNRNPLEGGHAPAAARGADMAGKLAISVIEAALGTTRTVRTGDGQSIEVQVPPGVETGGRLRIPGKGGRAPAGGGRPGDLFLNITITPHPFLRRVGDDIHVDLPISVIEALSGGRAQVPTVEGLVWVTIPPGTSSDQKLRLRGKGAKKPDGQRGDQICCIQIVVPKLDALEKHDEARRLVQELANLLGDTPVRKFQA
jgi:molecular chaperone DnaJ